MAKIFFSLSGEGRGHATRVRAVIEQLRPVHEVSLFTPGDAFTFLQPLYRGTEVKVRRVAGMRFHYSPERRLHYARTLSEASHYVCRLRSLLDMLKRVIVEEEPDLIVTDFEPALPRAGQQLGIPFVSLSHQHFLLTYDLSSLPLHLRLHAAYMRQVVRAYYSGQRETIVSSFYFPPLRPGCRNVTQVGVMFRPNVLAATPERGAHLVAYFRRFAGDQVLKSLAATGREVHVYGLGVRPAAGRLTFHAIEEDRFVDDLAACDALIATAGNQLVGEALYFGKPAFVMPEARNFEQYINAHFLKQSGAGDWAELERVRPADLQRFLGRLEAFRARIDRERLNGLPAALRVLLRCLPIPQVGEAVPAMPSRPADTRAVS